MVEVAGRVAAQKGPELQHAFAPPLSQQETETWKIVSWERTGTSRHATFWHGLPELPQLHWAPFKMMSQSVTRCMVRKKTVMSPEVRSTSGWAGSAQVVLFPVPHGTCQLPAAVFDWILRLNAACDRQEKSRDDEKRKGKGGAHLPNERRWATGLTVQSYTTGRRLQSELRPVWPCTPSSSHFGSRPLLPCSSPLVR